jgi:hypothetical protein
VEAVRHAQAAQDWSLAARLLADHWPTLHLDGQTATMHELVAGLPAHTRVANAELAVVAAADELAQGSLEAAERYLALAERQSASAPADRGEYGQLLLGVVRLLLARQRGNLTAVAADTLELQAMAEVADAALPGLGADLSALALISLGSTELFGTASPDVERYLDRGIALARRGGRPPWSSPAWPARRCTRPITASRGRPSAAGRRWSRPSGMAGPATRRSAWLAWQPHGDLVAQDEDLGILGTIGPGEQGEPAEYPEHREISES